jgi:hypothetical protein
MLTRQESCSTTNGVSLCHSLSLMMDIIDAFEKQNRMIMANLKLHRVDTDNSYLTHFYIANQNFNLFLTDEKIIQLMKRILNETKQTRSVKFRVKDNA